MTWLMKRNLGVALAGGLAIQVGARSGRAIGENFELNDVIISFIFL